jgi:DNA repair photolyase
MSFIGDCYASEFDGEDVTREAIAILREHDVPVHVLTKGGMRASRDFPLLTGPGCAFGTTLCWTDDQDRLHWEPGAASVADRILAIKLAHNLGIRTFVSVEPIIVPEQAIALIEDLTPWVDEFRVGKLNYHPLAAEIEWARWTPKLLAAVKTSGRDYLIKQSLRQYLPEGAEVERRANA